MYKTFVALFNRAVSVHCLSMPPDSVSHESKLRFFMRLENVTTITIQIELLAGRSCTTELSWLIDALDDIAVAVDPDVGGIYNGVVYWLSSERGKSVKKRKTAFLCFLIGNSTFAL
jgi:hypothetical protein